MELYNCSMNKAKIKRLGINNMFPVELTSRKQWLLWSFEQYEGDKKPRKIPYYINGKKRQGTQGSPEDLKNLATYEQAKPKPL